MNFYSPSMVQMSKVIYYFFFHLLLTNKGEILIAVPNEKITWGKLDVDTPKFIIESDATIVAPLIFAYILNW